MEIFLPSLNGGEISDLLAGRGDFKQRQYGGSTVQDFLPLVQGPIIGRPGTEYINSVYSALERTHLLGFNTASGTSYVVEISPYVFRFYTSGALISGSNKTITALGGNATVTFTDAGDWVNWTGHGLPLNASVKFETTTTLPTGITANTLYYVYAVETNRFQICAAPNASQLTFTGTGSGTITGYHHLLTTSTEHAFNENDLITISGATGSPTLINGDWAVKAVTGPYSTVTISQANPGVVTWTAHGLAAGDKVIFRSTGTLPSGLSVATDYYVKTVLTADTFTVALSVDGAAIQTTSAGSGTHGAIADANYNRFEIHEVDGDNDFLSGDIDTADYTALAGSPVAKFTGKMHPYSSTDLFENNRFDVGTAVLGDTIYMAHKNHWPRKLKVNSSTDWDIDRHEHGHFTYTDGTIYPYFYDGPWVKSERDASTRVKAINSTNPGDTGNIDVYESKTSNPKYIFSLSDIGRLFRDEPDQGSNVKPAFFQITAFTSGAYVDVIRREDGGWASLHTGYRFGLFHESIGYPHRVSFYQDRISYSMMDDYPTRIEMSISSNYENFSPTDADDINEVLDSNAVSFELFGDGTGKIQWAVGGGKQFLVGTEGHIYSVEGTDSSILAPGKVKSSVSSTYGSENIPPIQTGGAIYYVENGGTRVRQALDTQKDASNAMDVTRACPNIFDSGALGMVFAKSPFSAAWAWRTDGQAVSLTIDEQESVYAFSRHILGGSYSTGAAVIESIAVINSSTYHSEIWFAVKRTINSATVRYVEKMSKSLYADYTVTQSTAVCSDCSYVYNSSAVTNVPSGALNHLIGQSVDVVADGLIVTGRTVNGSGQLDTALSTAASVIIVGLAYRPKFETTDLHLMSDKGATFGKVTRINAADIGFYRTLGAKVGRDSSNLHEIDFGAYTTSVQSLFTGVKKPEVNGIDTENPRVRIEQVIPAPICITFINATGVSNG